MWQIKIGRIKNLLKVDETIVSKFCSSCVWRWGKKGGNHSQIPHNRTLGCGKAIIFSRVPDVELAPRVLFQ